MMQRKSALISPVLTTSYDAIPAELSNPLSHCFNSTPAQLDYGSPRANYASREYFNMQNNNSALDSFPSCVDTTERNRINSHCETNSDWSSLSLTNADDILESIGYLDSNQPSTTFSMNAMAFNIPSTTILQTQQTNTETVTQNILGITEPHHLQHHQQLIMSELICNSPDYQQHFSAESPTINTDFTDYSYQAMTPSNVSKFETTIDSYWPSSVKSQTESSSSPLSSDATPRRASLPHILDSAAYQTQTEPDAQRSGSVPWRRTSSQRDANPYSLSWDGVTWSNAITHTQSSSVEQVNYMEKQSPPPVSGMFETGHGK